MLFRASRRGRGKKETQKQIGFHGEKFKDNGLFEKSFDFPGFAFRVDKGETAEFKFAGKVVIPAKLYQKMFLYATNITKEISGLGMVEVLGNELHITDLFIVEQEVTSGNTTLDNKDLAKKTIEMIDAGVDPSKMKLWWHSHTNGGMFWSVTDDRCCDAYDNNQWLLSMVVNYRKELRCRLDIYSPVRITLDNIPVLVEEPIGYLSELEEQCKSEMRDKVREKATSFSYGANAKEEEKCDWKCPGCSFIDKESDIVVAHMIRAHGYDRADAWQQVELEDKEEQPSENYNKDIPESIHDIVGSFEDIFNKNESKPFDTLAYRDTFDIYWRWDVSEQKYAAIWGTKRLSRSEYAFLAESLAQGIQIDKDLNAVV